MPLPVSLKKVLPTLSALGLAIVLTVAITGALRARVEDGEQRTGRDAMPVATVGFEELSFFERDQRFLGVVKAATVSDIGFELPGTVSRIAVVEGQVVEPGAELARLDRRSQRARREAAAATVVQLEAEAELAAARRTRQAALVDSGAISGQAFDDTRLGEQAILARLRAARAQLESLDIDLDKAILRAPYAARIGRQHLDEGTVTKAGTTVFTLIASGRREAQVGVAVEQADRLQPGQSYDLTLRGQTLHATLRGIRPDVDPISLTTSAIFTLPEGTVAYDGEPIAMRLPHAVSEKGGWLPLSALLEGDRGVWTVLALRERNQEHVALREVVEVLHVAGDRAYVRGTLRDGDRIVSDGIHRVAPGTRVVEAPTDTLARR